MTDETPKPLGPNIVPNEPTSTQPMPAPEEKPREEIVHKPGEHPKTPSR